MKTPETVKIPSFTFEVVEHRLEREVSLASRAFYFTIECLFWIALALFIVWWCQ